MAEIYTAPRVSRVAKARKERPDWLGLMGDLLSTGAGYYGSKYIADTQSKTAERIANIQAESQKALLQGQTDQLMKLMTENPMLKAQMDAMTANTESIRQGNRQNEVMLQQLIDASKIGTQERNVSRGLDVAESQKIEAGLGAQMTQAEKIAAAQMGAPAATQEASDILTRGTENLPTDSFLAAPISSTVGTITGSLTGIPTKKAKAAFVALKDKANSGNPAQQQAAIAGLQDLRSALQDSIDTTSGPLTSGYEYFFGPTGDHADWIGIQKEIDDLLAGPTLLQAGRALESPEVARMRAELPFAAEKRRIAEQGYGLTPAGTAQPAAPSSMRRLITAPAPTPAPVQTPAASPQSFRYAPPADATPRPPTTEEVHTPIRDDQSSMGPISDYGRMLAMRKLEELGLVA